MQVTVANNDKSIMITDDGDSCKGVKWVQEVHQWSMRLVKMMIYFLYMYLYKSISIIFFIQKILFLIYEQVIFTTKNGDKKLVGE